MPIKGDKAPAKKVRMLLLVNVLPREDPVPRGRFLSSHRGIALIEHEKYYKIFLFGLFMGVYRRKPSGFDVISACQLLTV